MIRVVRFDTMMFVLRWRRHLWPQLIVVVWGRCVGVDGWSVLRRAYRSVGRGVLEAGQTGRCCLLCPSSANISAWLRWVCGLPRQMPWVDQALPSGGILGSLLPGVRLDFTALEGDLRDILFLICMSISMHKFGSVTDLLKCLHCLLDMIGVVVCHVWGI